MPHASKMKIRAIWYTMMCALEDEEAQKKGIVNVYYNVDLEAPEPLYFELIRHVKMLDDSIPYRTISLHYCYNNAAIRPALELFQLIAGKKNRIRFRTHFGKLVAPCSFNLVSNSPLTCQHMHYLWSRFTHGMSIYPYDFWYYEGNSPTG